MRLIDADGLLEKINTLEHLSGEYADSFVNAAGNRFIELSRLEDYIKNAPSVDAGPVVHAHWIGPGLPSLGYKVHTVLCDRNGYVAAGLCLCSNCGEELIGSDEYAVKGRYCPNCGAKMEGKHEAD